MSHGTSDPREQASRLTRASQLRTKVRTDKRTIEWRAALYELAVLEGNLPEDLPVHRMSFFHSTVLQ